jgi:glycosyltransferase involved in cell wall biosynthesis
MFWHILFIGYWSLNDGLTQSTIMPHLQALAEMDQVDQLIFTSIEREEYIEPVNLNHSKLLHIPLHSKNLKPNILNKWYDFYLFPKRLVEICKQYKIDHMICRGAPAGALGYLVFKKTSIPFSVESFEPHAQYMLDSDTWSSFDPRYIMQKYWEKQIQKHAAFLLPVANNYRQKLIQQNIQEEKILLQPCEVQLSKFTIDQKNGIEVRRQLNISEKEVVGIYVGKFGDIYWKSEAFMLFKKAEEYFGKNFKLIILTPQNAEWIKKQLEFFNIPLESAKVFKASPEEVPNFLNAANFAFSLYRPGHSKKYLSPIKNGEYWACGLPVIIPDGIGDDSQILKETGLGVVMEDIDQPEKYFPQLEKLIQANKKEEIRQMAIKYRNPNRTKEVYQEVIHILSGHC